MRNKCHWIRNVALSAKRFYNLMHWFPWFLKCLSFKRSKNTCCVCYRHKIFKVSWAFWLFVRDLSKPTNVFFETMIVLTWASPKFTFLEELSCNLHEPNLASEPEWKLIFPKFVCCTNNIILHLIQIRDRFPPENTKINYLKKGRMQIF